MASNVPAARAHDDGERHFAGRRADVVRASVRVFEAHSSGAVAEWESSYMEDTVHYDTLLTSESLASVRTFIHDGGVQLSCARRGLRCVCR